MKLPKLKNIQRLSNMILNRPLRSAEIRKMHSWVKSYVESFEEDCCKVSKEDAVIDYIQEIWYNREAKAGRINPNNVDYPALKYLGDFLRILREK